MSPRGSEASSVRDEPPAAPEWSVAAAVEGREISFPNGFVGCTDWKRFMLQSPPEHAPIRVLQSLDNPELALFVLDPFLLSPDYAIDMPEAERRLVQLEKVEDAVLLVLLVIRRDPLLVTANLVGPVVINSRSGLGCQLVLEDTDYSVRHLVYSEHPGQGDKEDAA